MGDMHRAIMPSCPPFANTIMSKQYGSNDNVDEVSNLLESTGLEVEDAKSTPSASTSRSSMKTSTHQKPTNKHKPSPLAGVPIGPIFFNTSSEPVILRYMYEGGHIAQGRLCYLQPTIGNSNNITASQLVQTLANDGVDFDTFYACAYETRMSEGGWMPLEPSPRYTNPYDKDGNWKDRGVDENHRQSLDLTFPLPSSTDDSSISSRRIDIKLFRRPKTPSRDTTSIQSLRDVIDSEATVDDDDTILQQQSATQQTIEHSSDALLAISSAVPGGKLPLHGFFGIGILQPKTTPNVGTLWRSAFQLGASVLYTIGGRYKYSSTDTLNVPARVPLIELDDWTSFAEWAAPRSAVWVVIEMGGTPLKDFVHPRNAIYILGSEDHGVPKSVVRACREVVSLECEMYGSYNVAVAGSIVMYDRLIKMRKAEEEKASYRSSK